MSGVKVSTTENIVNYSYTNYGNAFVKFFSAKQFNTSKIDWEEGKNIWWCGWIYTLDGFIQKTPVYCPIFVDTAMTSSDPVYPFRIDTSTTTWYCAHALRPIINSNYNCINTPRILEVASLGENKYYLNSTACYEFLNVTQSCWWSAVWLPSRADSPNGSAGYRTSTATSFEGPVQFTTGAHYSNNYAKFEVKEYKWQKSDLTWSNFDIPYNKIDLKHQVYLPENANTYERSVTTVATGSFMHAVVNNKSAPDETYTDRWREGGYLYTKKFVPFDISKHTYQRLDPSTRLYEGLRLCPNPGGDGTLEVPFMVEKNKGTKCKIRFKYGPFTNENKTGNVTIKDNDGAAVNATEVEVSNYGVNHKITLAIDESYASNSDIYAIIIPFDGSSEYVTADAEKLEYVQGIKFNGSSFTFTKEN